MSADFVFQKCSLLSLLILAVVTPVAAELPEGYEPYVGLRWQFEIGLPTGWDVFSQNDILLGSPGDTGNMAFSVEKFNTEAMASGEAEGLRELMDQLANVELVQTRGFLLDRIPAQKGMSCDGFSAKAEKKLMKLMGTEPMFGPGRTTRKAPVAEKIRIGGCHGYRIKGMGETRNGDGKVLDVFAIADGKVLFLFKLLNLEEHYEDNVETFEMIMSTLRLKAAG